MVKKLILPILLAIIAGLIIYFVPPKNILIIFGLIFLVALDIYLATAVFLKKKYGFLMFIYVLLLLSINYFIGFDLLSVGLLTSLLIAVILLIK